MPLRPRQHNEAVEYLFNSLRQQGLNDDQIASDLGNLAESDRMRVFQNAFLKRKREEGYKTDVSEATSAVSGYTESALFSLPRVAGAVVEGAKAAVSGEDPVEAARSAWTRYEDGLAIAEIKNPNAYLMGEMGGYIGPGLATSLFKTGAKAAKTAGFGARAATAAGSGLAALGQTSVQRTIEGEASLGTAATDVGLALVAPAAGEKVLKAFASGGKSVRAAGAETLAKIGEKYSRALGTITDRTDELLAKAPEIFELRKAGLSTAKQELQQQTQTLMGNIQGYLDDLVKSIDLPESEIGKSGKLLQERFSTEIRGIAQAISEQAQSGQKIAKQQIKTAFDAIKGTAALGEKIVKNQFGAKIRPLEELGQNLQISIQDDVNLLADPLIDAGLLINRSGTPSNTPLGRNVRQALDKVFEAKKNPLNFKQLNDLRDMVDEVIDWNAQDPLNVGLRNLRTSLRDKLVSASKTLPTEIDFDRMLGEYMGAKKVAQSLQSAFYARTAEGGSTDVLPSVETLKKLVNASKGLKEMSPIDEAMRNHMQKIVRMTARESRMGQLTDPYQVSNKIRRLVSNEFFDKAKFQKEFESVLGKVKQRRQVFDLADSWDIPKEAKDAIKAGGTTFRDFMNRLPGVLQTSGPYLQKLHDQYHKKLRVSGYKANEIFELLQQKKAINPETIRDLYELASYDEIVAKITSQEELIKLASDPANKLNLKSGILRTAAGAGAATMLGGPKLAFALGFLDRFHAIMTQPVALRQMALKYKWVPPAKVDKWAQELSFFAAKVLPAVRGGATEAAAEQINQRLE